MIYAVEDMSKIVGKRLHHARQQAGMSETVAAVLIGISVQELRQLEAGETDLRAATLYNMAKSFGKPVHWFYVPLN
jgi:transcriptional regulator with XRE-family HTH domain